MSSVVLSVTPRIHQCWLKAPLKLVSQTTDVSTGREAVKDSCAVCPVDCTFFNFAVDHSADKTLKTCHLKNVVFMVFTLSNLV